MADPRPRPRRRWFTLSLRAMLGLVLVIGLGLGGWAGSAHTQADAVDAIQTIDPDASIEYAVDSRGFLMDVSPAATDEDKLPWWVPLRVYRLLGRDYFLTANLVSITLPNELEAHAAAIGQLAKLRHLGFLAINSPMNDADIERLAHLNQLQEFSVFARCSGVTDRAMTVIARWPRLEEIRLDNPEITDIGLAQLGRLPALRALNLIEFEGGSELNEKIIWTNLGIKWTGRATIEPGDFPALTELSLRVRLSPGADLHILGRLTGLESLDLSGRSILDDDLRHFATLRKLESLTLDEATLDGTGFRHLSGLSKLSHVSIAGPNITDATLPHLARLRNLASLSLTGTKVTAAGLDTLRAVPHLDSLRIIPPVAGDLARLRQMLPGCHLDYSIKPL